MAIRGLSGNRLLDSLPPAARRSITDKAQWVSLTPGQWVCREGQPITSVHFPVTAVVSLVTALQSGAVVEVSAIGSEGMTGAPVLLGTGTMPTMSCLNHLAGRALSVATPDFEQALAASPALRDICMRYVALLITQVGQDIACARLHNITQRCARWLLTTQDRAGSDSLHVTHDLLARVLGARRASITHALAGLDDAGVIRRVRGRVEIVNRDGLTRAACECYGVVHDALDGLLRTNGRRPPR